MQTTKRQRTYGKKGHCDRNKNPEQDTITNIKNSENNTKKGTRTNAMRDV